MSKKQDDQPQEPQEPTQGNPAEEQKVFRTREGRAHLTHHQIERPILVEWADATREKGVYVLLGWRLTDLHYADEADKRAKTVVYLLDAAGVEIEATLSEIAAVFPPRKSRAREGTGGRRTRGTSRPLDLSKGIDLGSLTPGIDASALAGMTAADFEDEPVRPEGDDEGTTGGGEAIEDRVNARLRRAARALSDLAGPVDPAAAAAGIDDLLDGLDDEDESDESEPDPDAFQGEPGEE